MFPFKLKGKQFLVRLSFSMTINKAQGQTIPNVGVYLPESVFSHGQLYVALSRGTSRENTKVLVKPARKFNRVGVYTSNVVYQEVLRDLWGRNDYLLLHVFYNFIWFVFPYNLKSFSTRHVYRWRNFKWYLWRRSICISVLIKHECWVFLLFMCLEPLISQFSFQIFDQSTNKKFKLYDDHKLHALDLQKSLPSHRIVRVAN